MRNPDEIDPLDAFEHLAPGDEWLREIHDKISRDESLGDEPQDKPYLVTSLFEVIARADGERARALLAAARGEGEFDKPNSPDDLETPSLPRFAEWLLSLAASGDRQRIEVIGDQSERFATVPPGERYVRYWLSLLEAVSICGETAAVQRG